MVVVAYVELEVEFVARRSPVDQIVRFWYLIWICFGLRDTI